MAQKCEICRTTYALRCPRCARLASASPWPTVEEFHEVLWTHEHWMSADRRKMLAFHFHAPDRTITCRELANLLGSEWHGTTNLHYGSLGREIGERITKISGWHKPPGENVFWLEVLSSATKAGKEEDWRWHMRPELVSVLGALNWR